MYEERKYRKLRIALQTLRGETDEEQSRDLDKHNVTRQKKVTVLHAIFEVNIIIGEVLDFMSQFDDKYWKNYLYLKYYSKNTV